MGRPRKRRANRRRARLRERLPSPRVIGAAVVAAASRQRRPLVAVAIAAVAVGAIAGGRAWLTTSPRFAVDRVTINGAALTPRAAITARLELETRPNIFLYDTDAAAARLETSPWIRSAEVSRDLPDGLVIDVVEREPAALVVAGGLYIADETGELFKRATAAEAVGLDVVAVTGLSREAVAADRQATAELVRRAVALGRRWTSAPRPALGEINIDPVRGFTLITAERAVAVRVGPSTDAGTDARLALFDRAWAALDAEQRARVAMVHLDQSASPSRATVAFEHPETSSAPASPAPTGSVNPKTPAGGASAPAASGNQKKQHG